eukprot:913830_1
MEYCARPRYVSTLLILPRCLLSARFISSDYPKDAMLENIKYFANVIQFELIGQSHMVTGIPLSVLIQHMYEVPHLTITPWTDVTAFIELFEMLHTKYLKESIVDLLEKCIDIDSTHLPLSIFYNGHSRQQSKVKRIQEKDMQLMHQNIDALFHDFLIKYCTTKAMVMEK